MRSRLNDIYAMHTGKHISEIEQAMERDKYMTPEEALEFGVIDHVVRKGSINQKNELTKAGPDQSKLHLPGNQQ